MTLSRILGLIDDGHLDASKKIFYRQWWRTDQYHKSQQLVQSVVVNVPNRVKSRYHQKEHGFPELWLKRSQNAWRLFSESHGEVADVNREMEDGDFSADDWQIADTTKLSFSL